jgi:hypothetical protein
MYLAFCEPHFLLSTLFPRRQCGHQNSDLGLERHPYVPPVEPTCLKNQPVDVSILRLPSPDAVQSREQCRARLHALQAMNECLRCAVCPDCCWDVELVLDRAVILVRYHHRFCTTLSQRTDGVRRRIRCIRRADCLRSANGVFLLRHAESLLAPICRPPIYSILDRGFPSNRHQRSAPTVVEALEGMN